MFTPPPRGAWRGGSAAGRPDAVVALDLSGAERGAVQRRFLELTSEIEVIARLALGNLQHSAGLRLVRAGHRGGASRHTVDVQGGGGAIERADQVLPGIQGGGLLEMLIIAAPLLTRNSQVPSGTR